MKTFLSFIVLFAWFSLFISGTAVTAATSDSKKAEMIQKHVEKMKRKNPQKYEAMVQAAGGNITDCLNCHVDIFKETSKKQLK